VSIFDPKLGQARRLADSKPAQLQSAEAITAKAYAHCERAFRHGRRSEA
jgi:hypothetical protein